MSAIKAGDLVVVVKASLCCGRTQSIGRIFIAGSDYAGRFQCPNCGIGERDDLIWVDGKHRVFEKSRLRRIPPLAELRYADRFEEERI